MPSFSLNAPYIISNGIVYNFIKEPGNVSLGEVSVGNNQNINTEDIIIPNTITVKGKAYAVTKIEDGAFFTNNNIKTISFGKSINSVSSSAFTKCSSLEKINVSADNPYFKSIDGILYNSSLKNLIKYPEGNKNTSYTIKQETNEVNDYAFYGNDYIKEIELPVNLFKIGSYTFADCPMLNTVKMGVNVLEISDYAFYKSGVQTINLSPAITKIGKGAFAFTDITKIVLPSPLDEIKEGTFYNCESLNEITLGSGLSVIGDYAFSNVKTSSIKFPEKVSSVGIYAFSECSNLKTVELNSALSSIGNNAFYNCSSIKTINLPKSLKTLGEDVFTGCTSLETFTSSNGDPVGYSIENGILYNKNVTTLIHYPSANIASIYTIPSSLTKIADNALADCIYINEFNINSSEKHFDVEDGVLYDYHRTTLIRYPLGKGGSDFTIPDTVTKISNKAFKNADISGVLNLPSSLKEIGEYAFEGCSNINSFNVKSNDYFCSEDGVLYNKDKTELIQFIGNSNLIDFTVPSSVKKIRDGAFSDLKLNSIKLNDGLEYIGDYAFSNTNITEINLPESLEEIGDYSFSNTNIKNITFPGSIKKIGNYSFKNCADLVKISFTSENTPEIESNAFWGCGLSSINLLSSAINSKDEYIKEILALNIDNADNFITEE